ncbi:MAG: B12-binding domain-containing radical SAM protein [Burkholderiales bacterium]|nr:B12-binding domain-containing radical SAM protein [Burkholderiales bacterium]
MARVRLLLVNPRYPESFWSFRWAVERVLPRAKRTVNPPLGLATLAALCPPDWEVSIVDENVEPVPLEPQADLVGVCGMGVQFPRQKALLDYYRRRGYPVVAGGSYASLCPELYGEHADSVVAGEAEYIWPAFCRDFEAGAAKPLYRETGVVRLEDSPTPRFDLLKLERYTTATLQFSRGCPFRCEFCDIIVMFGRKPRTKTVAQVERELDALRRLGVRNAFFVDDNLIGNKPVAKALLRFLADYQARHGRPFAFGTEASLNLAHDEELLSLFREAGFGWVFIGIESPDPATLRATRKHQNTQGDPIAAIRRIYAHGIDVLAGFIVGFDQDTPETFDAQHDFIVRSGIQAAMVGLLTALPHTPLHARLAAEGRLRADVDPGNNTRLATNVVPLGMSYETMIDRYRALYRRLVSDAGIARRIRNKLAHMPRPAYRGEYTLGEQVGIVARLLARGILAGGWPRVKAFARSLPWTRPRQIPLAVSDWIAGLAMRDYVERRFGLRRAAAPRRVARWARAVQRAAAAYVKAGAVGVDLAADRGGLAVHLKGLVDGEFFRRTLRPIDRLLARTQATLALRVEALSEPALPEVRRWLARLARHGDRVSIFVAERWRATLAVDSSVFDVVLEGE